MLAALLASDWESLSIYPIEEVLPEGFLSALIPVQNNLLKHLIIVLYVLGQGLKNALGKKLVEKGPR